MSLEQEVRKEIDSWDVTLLRLGDAEVRYSDLVKPLLYGIGIGVTEKIAMEIAPLANKKFLDLPYQEATLQFKKTYLLQNLEKHDYSVTETAPALYPSCAPEIARQTLSHTIGEVFGLPARELRELQKVRTPSFDKETSQEYILQARTEIQRYAQLFPANTLLRRLLDDKAELMAERFVRVVVESVQKDYPWELFDLPYGEAQTQFRSWYLTEQIKRHGSGAAAAKHTGQTPEAFRQATHYLGIKVAEVLRSA